MTLIEVLAGIVLLSTLLVLVVVSAGRFSSRIRDSSDQIAAARALDVQLAEWISADGSLPRERNGSLSSDARFQWRITRLERISEDVPARRVRIDVFAKRQAVPLVSVELVEADTLSSLTEPGSR